MRRPPFLATLLGLIVLASGCKSSPTRSLHTTLPSPTTAAPSVAVPGGDLATPTATPTAAPTRPRPTSRPTPAPPTYDVKAVQRRLTELSYYFGPVDGDRGAAFRSAVMAFQKVNGLGADGSVGKMTLAALKHPRRPVLRGTGAGTRVEVDLTRQVLYVVRNGTVARILPVSSGSGRHYLTKNGNRATALSPVGYYRVQRRILGERHADLGTLYDPQYFYRGWAIHGSNSVPAYPASHGCIRVTRADAKYLLRAITVGTPVYLYGGSFTFTAGSSAPGTDDPGGDTATDPAPASPTPKPTTPPRPSPSPTASPSPSPSPTILPTP